MLLGMFFCLVAVLVGPLGETCQPDIHTVEVRLHRELRHGGEQLLDYWWRL